MLRQSDEDAKNLPSRAVSLDIIAQTAIPVTTPIADPQSKTALRLKLSGVNLVNFALNGGRQRLDTDRLEIRREEMSQVRAQSIPVTETRLASYLQPTPFMQTDHPSIRALSAKIVQGETNGHQRRA